MHKDIYENEQLEPQRLIPYYDLNVESLRLAEEDESGLAESNINIEIMG